MSGGLQEADDDVSSEGDHEDVASVEEELPKDCGPNEAEVSLVQISQQQLEADALYEQELASLLPSTKVRSLPNLRLFACRTICLLLHCALLYL